MNRLIRLVVGALALLAGLIVSMGWLGTAEIEHRTFDMIVLLLSGVALIYISFKLAKPVDL